MQLRDDCCIVYRHFLQAAASCSGGGTTDRETFGAELICSSLKCIKNNAPLLQAVWHALWRRQSTEDLPLKVFQAFNSSMKNRFETAGSVQSLCSGGKQLFELGWIQPHLVCYRLSCGCDLCLSEETFLFSNSLVWRMRLNPCCILEIFSLHVHFLSLFFTVKFFILNRRLCADAVSLSQGLQVLNNTKPFKLFHTVYLNTLNTFSQR